MHGTSRLGKQNAPAKPGNASEMFEEPKTASLLWIMIALAILSRPFRVASSPSRVKYPGICQASVDLGVSRIHLYFVVTGARRSPRIEASEWFKQVTRRAS